MRDNYYICIIRKLIHLFTSLIKTNAMNDNNGYSGLAIADYLIKKANQDNKLITNMAVLKMIYFAQGFGFSELKKQLIKDDFYAWKFGPVEINTYNEFKQYGAGGILSPSGKTDIEIKNIESDEKLICFLDKIYTLLEIHPYALSNKTHEAGSPWDLTPIFQVIKKDIIKDYFIQKRWKKK